MYPISQVEGYRQMFGVPPNVVHGIKKFIYTGGDQYFIVPDGVWGIWVSMCGAGGGAVAPSGGGATNFGSYLQATGGSNNTAGSPNGGIPSTGAPFMGGPSPFGVITPGDTGAGRGYGVGTTDNVSASGGGGGWYLDEFIAVTPGQVILVQVGAPPAGGGGSPGVCIVKF